MGRLLDFPTPTSAAESQLTANSKSRFADVPWPEPPCRGNQSSNPLPAVGSCSSDVALLVAGEFREFLPPYKPGERHWKNITPEKVWARLYEAVVKPNGPADLFVHSWDTALARQLVSALPSPPCSSVCETYGEEFASRVLARYDGFRYIRGYLRLNNSKETPHVVDFFYKRYAALKLLERFEASRQRAYRAVVLSRPDVYFLSPAVHVRHLELEPLTVYAHDTDHQYAAACIQLLPT